MSYNCNNYNCDDLGEHLLNDCGDRLESGFAAALVLECDHEITDPSVAQELLDAISNGQATLIKDINYLLGAPSPVTQESTVAQSMDTITRYDRSGTFTDGNVNATNVDFYNSLASERPFGGIIFYNRLEEKIFWVDQEVKFQGGLDDSGDLMIFTGNILWRTKPSRVNPEMFDAPAGVFN